MNVLLTGGTGYIGSHTAVTLTEAGHRVVLYDNLCNSDSSVIDRLARLIGHAPAFVKGDARDTALLTRTLRQYHVDAVIHFAGYKAVGESSEHPLMYYDNNVGGAVSLLLAMQLTNVNMLIFSSSATVYGEPRYLPIDEQHSTFATHPYGRSKLYVETILADTARSDGAWRIACLRYFNPVGAHESGLIGESPCGIPNNLMPYIARVATGELSCLKIFGADYPTPDGSGVRDYIHIMDLAEGHLAALNYLATGTEVFSFFNLGTGQGLSVFDMVSAFEDASGRNIPYQITRRRDGDVASSYASADKAAAALGWHAQRTVSDMCASAWNFQMQSSDVKQQNNA